MYLDDRVLGEPCIMLHTFLSERKPFGLDSVSLLLIKFVTHSDVQRPRDDGDIFIIRMSMRRDLVSSRYLQANDIEPLLRRIATYNGKLSAFRERGRGSTPFQTIGGNDDHMIIGRRHRERHPTYQKQPS